MNIRMKKSEQKPNNAVIYARYSSHAQKDTSIEQQLEVCRDFAQKNDIKIIGEYCDRAISGTSDKRPEFMRMIKDSAKKRWQRVLIYKVDRFARNRYDSAMYKARLKKNGVKVISVTEPIPDGPEGILLESVLEGSAEYYSANLSQNVRRGLRANALECKVNSGGIPLGYHKGADGRFEIVPEAAAVVREIYAMYINGKNRIEIADALNARGLRTLRGGKFNKNSLRTLLQNERYTGVYKYADIRIEGGMPAIISKETFDMAQKVIEKNARAPAASWSYEDYLLTGKLFCGKCGSAMVGECGTSKTGVRYNYYICSKRRRERACDKKTVRKNEIEELVARWVVENMLTDGGIKVIADAVMTLQRKEQEKSELESLRQQLSDVERRLKNIVSAIEDGGYTPATKDRLNELEEQKRQLIERIDDVKAKMPQFSREQIVALLKSYKGGDPADPAFQARLIDTFVNAVYLYDDHAHIICNYTQNAVKTADIAFADAVETGDCSPLMWICPPKRTKTNPGEATIIVTPTYIVLTVQLPTSSV